MEEKDDIKRLLDLLGEEITESNDSNQLDEWSALMGVTEESFSADFVDDVMDKVSDKTIFQIDKSGVNKGRIVEEEMDFSAKVVQMFSKIAFSGAAAILILIGYSWFSEGSVSPDALLGFNQVNEVAMDITSNFYSNY